MKKIKVFFGAYINSTNAQNLNCLALVKYLDKDKFEVYALELESGDFNNNQMNGVHIFRCFYPHRISKYLGYLWGIWKSDVAYLPKLELEQWNKALLKVFRTKSFKTVEGIYDVKHLQSVMSSGKNYEQFLNSFKGFDKIYSITRFLKHYNYKHHNISTEDNALYLGNDIEIFLNNNKFNKNLNSIVFIGRVFKRKGIYDFLELAKYFPKLDFHIVGEGEEVDKIKQIIKEKNIINIIYHGRLTHHELSDLLKVVNLNILPSHTEGFPKVILETAAAGVPSLVYSSYGPSEWMTHRTNGFIADTLDQMKEIIQELINNPDLLQTNSKNAIEMAKKFDWKVLVKEWERIIEEVVQK